MIPAKDTETLRTRLREKDEHWREQDRLLKERGIITTLTPSAREQCADDLDKLAAADALSAPPQPYGKVNRFEVIDRRTPDGVIGRDTGRVYTARGCRIEVLYQDDGTTLKVFVNGNRPAVSAPPQRTEETKEQDDHARTGEASTATDGVAAASTNVKASTS